MLLMRGFLIILGVVALAGCAIHEPARTGEHIVEGAGSATDPNPGETPMQASTAPQFVIPISGGPMIAALPLGGSFFLPVDDGPPVTGLAILQGEPPTGAEYSTRRRPSGQPRGYIPQ